MAGEEEVRSLLQSVGRRPEIPAEDLKTIKAAARVEWLALVDSEREPSRPRIQQGLALAASLLLGVALAWWWWSTATTPSQFEAVAAVELLRGEVRAAGPESRQGEISLDLAVGQALAAETELETVAAGEGSPARLALRLSGGQSIRLDAGTRLRLLSSQRLELERGAVYFDSGAEPPAGGAVEILTPLGVVTDVGTQYEVRLSNGDDVGVRVRVRQGAVTLRRDGESYPAAKGEELTLRQDGTVARGLVSSHGPAWDWVVAAAPSLDIEGRSLRSFLDWVSRETGWAVRYADEAIEASAAETSLHGSIEDLTPQESLSVVLPGAGLGFRVEDGALLITRPLD